VDLRKEDGDYVAEVLWRPSPFANTIAFVSEAADPILDLHQPDTGGRGLTGAGAPLSLLFGEGETGADGLRNPACATWEWTAGGNDVRAR